MLPSISVIFFAHLFCDCASSQDRPTLHILLNTIPPCLPQCRLCLSSSASITVQSLIQSMSSLYSICEYYLSLTFLITSLCSANCSELSSIFFHSFKVNIHPTDHAHFSPVLFSFTYCAVFVSRVLLSYQTSSLMVKIGKYL